jgi:glutaminase
LTPVVSTGELPEPEVVTQQLDEALTRYRSVETGKVADYIPALAKASADWFGISVVGVRGRQATVGDGDILFSIQSISKPFVFALVCEELGQDVVRQKIGVNNTGLPFNSVMAIELNPDRTMNPMVNAGAIATTSLVPGTTADEKWQFILDGLSRFAGRPLEVDDDVYASESATNEHNRGIATLVAAYGRLYAEPAQTVDLYTRQCSLKISVGDLAVMGSTLANGGVNPITGERVIGPELCKRVLAVLATTGLYERSGEWLYEIGLPGKSGVSGGIVTVSPGKGSLATFSPPLDAAGNSVRGQLATEFLSEYLGLNIFASTPR